MQTTWENEVAQLLTDLLAVQDDLFVNLAKKRELLIASDMAGLTAIAPEEEQLVARLQAVCSSDGNKCCPKRVRKDCLHRVYKP